MRIAIPAVLPGSRAPLALSALLLFLSCAAQKSPPAVTEMVVFHAGSLSVPLREIASAFEKENPGVKVLLEAAGSRACARKITDLGRICDVMASADYAVIDELLIPVHASWSIKFATNEMAIVYRKESRGAGRISGSNWFNILLEKEVAFGRSDPDSDPCGYRAVQAMKLAEDHYGVAGLAEKLMAKDREHIRPKETDLLALLESGTIDYLFLYRSVAVQHGLEFLTLPDEINLRNPDLAEHYAKAEILVSGREPGSAVARRGEPIVYGVTIPINAPNPSLAETFVAFLLDPAKGIAIMERCGQPSAVPSPTPTYDSVPASLRRYAKQDGAPGEESTGEADSN